MQNWCSSNGKKTWYTLAIIYSINLRGCPPLVTISLGQAVCIFAFCSVPLSLQSPHHLTYVCYVVGTPPCTTIRKPLYAAVWQCDESFAFSIFALLETSFPPTDCLLFFYYIPLLNTTENRTNVNDIKSSTAILYTSGY